MALEYKDYYKTLGVPRSASDDEIRKAFRKLARLYHPDVAKNKTGAEDKFKEINEAYEVLGDATKRKKYDELGPNWNQPGPGFRPPPGARQGRRPGGGQNVPPDFEFGGTGFSDFFEQLFGARRAAGMGGGRPGGAGFAQPGENVEADLMVTLEEASHGSIRQVTLRRTGACPQCQGSGESSGRSCPVCGGTGEKEQTETHKVKIPPGVREGQKLRVPGQGGAGAAGGAPGDLFLLVRFAKHPEFEVRGGDLHHELDIAPWEAALGANVSVPTLESRVNIRIPSGTQTGQKLRVRGKGLPSRDGTSGDLIVEARIVVPTQLDEAQRGLWTKLAEESRFNPRE